MSKSKIKFITALARKKNRDEEGLFLAEGTKLVSDLSNGLTCVLLCATREWLDENSRIGAEEIIEITQEELKKISNQQSPQGVIAVFEKPVYSWNVNEISNQLSLLLDDIQDPGNLGTIIRVADWFGINNIFCSKNTADVYNPKTVQATMGALAHVKTHVVDVSDFLNAVTQKEIPVYGTFLDGENIYQHELAASGIIVMGNEGNGISKSVENRVTHKLLIPNYPVGEETSESLNVGIATALVCAEFRRRLI